jgi:hypothetical protein
MGGLAIFFRRNYEDFIEDHTKRDGRDGLGPTLGNRHSHTEDSEKFEPKLKVLMENVEHHAVEEEEEENCFP